jgi:hypothetical protein
VGYHLAELPAANDSNASRPSKIEHAAVCHQILEIKGALLKVFQAGAGKSPAIIPTKYFQV